MDEMTIGEISRSLERLEKSQGEQTKKLDQIKSQTEKTNGFVGRHEDRLRVIDREIVDLKRHHEHAHTAPSVPVTTADGESIQIKISNKMWGSLVGITALLSPLLFDWLKKVFGGP